LPPIRRIGYRDPETGKHYVFITNQFKWSAQTIADIYKQRWQVELFFKWIKQNLKIKAFLGVSQNAVRNQAFAFNNTVLSQLLKMLPRHEWAALNSIAAKIGCTAETLRKWVCRAERDQGLREELTSSDRERLRALERENRELKRANEILRKASAYIDTVLHPLGLLCVDPPTVCRNADIPC